MLQKFEYLIHIYDNVRLHYTSRYFLVPILFYQKVKQGVILQCLFRKMVVKFTIANDIGPGQTLLCQTGIHLKTLLCYEISWIA